MFFGKPGKEDDKKPAALFGGVGATGALGAGASSFAPPGGGLFGQKAPGGGGGSLFGSKPETSGGGSTLFGQSSGAGVASGSSSGLFGAKPADNPGGLFGASGGKSSVLQFGSGNSPAPPNPASTQFTTQ